MCIALFGGNTHDDDEFEWGYVPESPFPRLHTLRLHMAIGPLSIEKIMRSLPELRWADLVETTDNMDPPDYNGNTKLQHLSYAIDLEQGSVWGSQLSTVLRHCPDLRHLCVKLEPAPSIESVNALLNVFMDVFVDNPKKYIPIKHVTLLLRGIQNPHRVNWRRVKSRFSSLVLDLRYGGYDGSHPYDYMRLYTAVFPRGRFEVWYTTATGEHEARVNTYPEGQIISKTASDNPNCFTDNEGLRGPRYRTAAALNASTV